MVMWSTFHRMMVLPAPINPNRNYTQCESNDSGIDFQYTQPPPKLQRVETFTEKLWRKVCSWQRKNV